jgi:general stress protein 26
MADKVGLEAKEKVVELLRELNVGMMATRHDDGTMHARPMATYRFEPEGRLWYLADTSSEKIADIRRHDEILVSYADPEKNRYVSVTGHASIVEDRQAIADAWSEAARMWFPGGAEDPSLVAIRLDIDHAEYWDAKTNMMVVVRDYAKSLLAGKRAEERERGRAEF